MLTQGSHKSVFSDRVNAPRNMIMMIIQSIVPCLDNQVKSFFKQGWFKQYLISWNPANSQLFKDVVAIEEAEHVKR